jgi:hypothetical protein
MSVNWVHYLNFIDSSFLPSTSLNYCWGKQTALNSMALDAYIYGYPLVLMDVTKNIMLANGSQQNQFLNERVFPNPQYTTIIRPNVDTLYSMAWLSLSKGPVVLCVPDTHRRYYLMEFLDAWTNVFASIGARTTGTQAGAYAITGPNWNGMLPEGIIRVQAPTNTVWIIGRTQTNGPKDYPIIHAIQDQYTLVPLKCWGKLDEQYKSDTKKNQFTINPVDQVATMNAATFFQIMMKAMHKNPPWIKDPAMYRKLTALGLIPGKTLVCFNLRPSAKHALDLAANYGPRLIKAEASKRYIQNNINGWALLIDDIGFYGTDYLQRAIVAMTGIGANLPQDSVYAPAFIDANKMPLAGYNDYRIHFESGQFPPVNAFWSITIYNDKGYLVENSINRYAIGPHLKKLNYNADGSLDIFIGNLSPGKDYINNWLPAPKGSFNLILRMYWPKQSVLSEQWRPPGIIRI